MFKKILYSLVWLLLVWWLFWFANAQLVASSQTVDEELSIGWSPLAIDFDDDWDRLYILDTNNDLYLWDCTGAYDVSTCTKSATTIDIWLQDSTPKDIKFWNSWNNFYVPWNATNTIMQYNCTGAYDLTTCTYSQSSAPGSETNVTWISFKSGWTILYYVWTTDWIRKATCTTGRDISSCSYVAWKDLDDWGVYFQSIYVDDTETDAYIYDSSWILFWFKMWTPWDASTTVPHNSTSMKTQKVVTFWNTYQTDFINWTIYFWVWGYLLQMEDAFNLSPTITVNYNATSTGVVCDWVNEITVPWNIKEVSVVWTMYSFIVQTFRTLFRL